MNARDHGSTALDLAELPKVDLHRHLEGSIRPATAVELGKATGVFDAAFRVADFEDKAVVPRPTPLLEVLERFSLFRAPIRSYEAVVRIVDEAIEDAVADRVTHLSLRFSPSTLAKAAAIGMAESFRAVAEGLRRGLDAWPGIVVELLVVVSRRRGLDAAWDIVRVLDAGAADTVAGIDFASDEIRYSTAQFADVARALAEMNLPLTIHTGEGVGPQAISEALALPGVRRLGHALSLVEDDELVREVVERGITVESCPTSNVRSSTVASLARHPAPELIERGVKVVICSDDPTLFGIDLSHELQVARHELGLSDGVIEQMQQWGREAMFGG